MYIRLFTYSNNEEECKKIFDDIISDIGIYIDEMYDLNIEQYWKIEELYLLEVKIKFKVVLTEERFKSFLDTISDKWEFNGHPVYKVLISEGIEGCDYIKENVSFVSIFFNSDEILSSELEE